MRRTKAERDARNAARPKIGVRTSNPEEIAVCIRLEAEGWTVMKRGWPDFLCHKNGHLRFIEVKRRSEVTGLPYRMKDCQRTVAAWLKDCLGIQVEVFTE